MQQPPQTSLLLVTLAKFSRTLAYMTSALTTELFLW